MYTNRGSLLASLFSLFLELHPIAVGYWSIHYRPLSSNVQGRGGQRRTARIKKYSGCDQMRLDPTKRRKLNSDWTVHLSWRICNTFSPYLYYSNLRLGVHCSDLYVNHQLKLSCTNIYANIDKTMIPINSYTSRQVNRGNFFFLKDNRIKKY